MVVRRRKKNSRQRGSSTHGWGSMKKHRGKGNKGGAGKAGTGKRGDSKKPSYWKSRYFGKVGFKKRKNIRKVTALNLIDIEQKINIWLNQKKISKEGDTFIIDCGSLGYNKLLGKGFIQNKLKIMVDAASERAIKKVQEKGGEVMKVKKSSSETSDNES